MLVAIQITRDTFLTPFPNVTFYIKTNSFYDLLSNYLYDINLKECVSLKPKLVLKHDFLLTKRIKIRLKKAQNVWDTLSTPSP